MKRIVYAWIALMLFTATAYSQISMTVTGSYSQDFNSLVNTGNTTWTDNATLANWYAQRTGTGTTIVAGDGSSNSGALYSFGVVGDPERALGSVGSGTPGNFAWGVLLQNNSGYTITDIQVSYYGEQWRNGGGTTPTAQTVAVLYQVSPSMITALTPNNNTGWTAVTALDFISPIYSTTAAALNGNDPANRVIFPLTSLPTLSVANGEYIMIKWDDPNHTGNDHGMAIDSLVITWTVTVPSNTVTTGTIAGSPFCVSATSSAAVSVPYTVSGTFNAGNAFEAYLSDATGSFAAETLIGSLSSQTDGTISATIPAGTTAGAGYRIRVKATDPATVGSQSTADLTVNVGPEEVSSVSAIPGTNQITLNWTNAVNCTDELMIVAKPIATIAGNATGDGTAYICNSSDITDPVNSVFDGTGSVIFKSASPGTSVIVTGLTNGTTYYFRFFTRFGTDWNNNIEISGAPLVVTDVIPPVALNAVATSLTDVTVMFDEDLNITTAQNAANYTWDVAVTGAAVLQANPDTVVLTLSTPLQPGVTDTLRVTGISDVFGNVMTLTYKFPIVFGTIPLDVDTIVYWNFPNSPDDTLADGGIPANLLKLISREPGYNGVFAYNAGAPGTSISATNWDAGMETKYWVISFSTWLYDSIAFSSKQRSSGFGPRDFRVDWSYDGFFWFAVPGTDVVVANNFTSGVLTDVDLPVDTYSEPIIYLRWVMTTDTCTTGDTTTTALGTSRIDEIYVTGVYNPLLDVRCDDCTDVNFNIYPNPTDGNVTLLMDQFTNAQVEIVAYTGKVISTEQMSGTAFRLDLNDLAGGIYFVRITDKDSKTSSIKKISVY
jgi:hypothetical protein